LTQRWGRWLGTFISRAIGLALAGVSMDEATNLCEYPMNNKGKASFASDPLGEAVQSRASNPCC
jgi:hypothetical protein